MVRGGHAALASAHRAVTVLRAPRKGCAGGLMQRASRAALGYRSRPRNRQRSGTCAADNGTRASSRRARLHSHGEALHPTAKRFYPTAKRFTRTGPNTLM